MKTPAKAPRRAEPEVEDSDYDSEQLFIDVCKAVIALLLIGMVIYAAI